MIEVKNNYWKHNVEVISILVLSATWWETKLFKIQINY